MALMIAAYAAQPIYRELPVREDERDSFIFERRHDARTRLARPIRVIELNGGKHIAGRSRDLSCGGMRIEIPLNSSIRVGDVLHIDVGTLGGLGPLARRPRVIPARVVWTHREQKMLRPLQHVGVEFAPDEDALINVA